MVDEFVVATFRLRLPGRRIGGGRAEIAPIEMDLAQSG